MHWLEFNQNPASEKVHTLGEGKISLLNQPSSPRLIPTNKPDSLLGERKPRAAGFLARAMDGDSAPPDLVQIFPDTLDSKFRRIAVAAEVSKNDRL